MKKQTMFDIKRQAYEAGLAGHRRNPHKRNTQQWRAWDRANRAALRRRAIEERL